MKRLFSTTLVTILISCLSVAQQPASPQKPEPAADDIVRISTTLVQTDLVVLDKDGKPVPDLKLDEFKVFENGKRQEVKFIEYISDTAGPRIEGSLTVAGRPVEPEIAKNLSAENLHRVFAFVVDDLTIPFDEVANVRRMLTNFVDNRMREGDLVAIVRVVGGTGLLQQFTSDRAILRRAIAQINPQLHPFSAFNNIPTDRSIHDQVTAGAQLAGAGFPAEAISASNTNLDISNEGVSRAFRSLITLQVAGDVTMSLKGLPGRKNLILVSGGLPLSESGPREITVDGLPITVMETRNYLGNASLLLRQLLDKATRAGVVINAMDIRGMNAYRGVGKFTDPGNEATSGLFGGAGGRTAFGRTANMAEFDNLALDTNSGHLGLAALADSTGGVSVLNTNDFDAGLDRIMARSNYYVVAYAPSEAFDNKYHKIEVKVSRPGAKVYAREGYFATPEANTGPLTREQAIFKAAMSPLAKREVQLAGRLQYRFVPEGGDLDINMLVDANNLTFKQDSDGKYRASFDMVGFVANSQGKSAGGFSQTVTAALSPADYQRSLTTGLSYTAHAQLPSGSFQLRAVVRDTESGRLGSMSQYFEIPDLAKNRLTASSVFLYAIDITPGTTAKPNPLTALRQLPRKEDLRYAVVVYNPKVTSAGQTQLRSQLVVSRDGKIIYQEPESDINGTLQAGQVVKIGQLGLAKAQPGRYVLTVVITDPQAKKEERTIMRSVDFYLVD